MTAIVFTVAEAAERLQGTESWLRVRVSSAAIPCVRFGRHIRFTSEQLDQIVRDNAKTPVVSKRRTA